jgi:hypothetical protein
MNVVTKTVLLDGREWQLTQLFRSYFPTGSASRGTGNGHVSLEPGIALRYKWSPVTYFHGDLKYWFPLGADPDHSGPVLNYGFGISHVAYDSDEFAILPTLELLGWTVLDGRQSLPTGGLPQEVDSFGILNLHPGVRFVWDRENDWGRIDLGIGSGFSLTSDHWYSSVFRIDLRCSY